ncbi:hypothetical protein M9Y10_035204 [Tritrichomonas musculus]|uniref:Regulator of chromosome condensation n=1 Tax=Tritrichomonas musculus TaxID=1915356 RepID=A0ABR2KHK4_9EUKA
MTLISAGWNQFGQLGREGEGKTPSPVDFPPSEYRCISVGQLHSVIVDNKGDVYGWGSNEDGGLGFKGQKEIRKPKKIEVDEKITLSSCGYCNTVLLAESGNVYIINDEGTWKADLPEPCIFVCSGYYLIWAVGRNGTIYQCGDTSETPPTPYKIPAPATKISAGNGFAIALTKDGEAYGTGAVVSNPDDDDQEPENNFVKIESLKGIHIKKVSAFDSHCLAVSNNGKVFVWGNGGQGKLGTGNCDTCSKFQEIIFQNKIIDIGAGTSHSCFVAADGSVYGCGSNESGQALLKDNETLVNVPQKSTTVSGCVAVQCGGHTLAIINGKPPSSNSKDEEEEENDTEKTKGTKKEESGKKGGKSSCCLLI